MYRAERQGGTLNCRRATSPPVRLGDVKERWEASDHPQGVLSQNWSEIEPNRTVNCMVFKASNNWRTTSLMPRCISRAAIWHCQSESAAWSYSQEFTAASTSSLSLKRFPPRMCLRYRERCLKQSLACHTDSTDCIKSLMITEGWPERSSSWTFVQPSLNFLAHFRTLLSLITSVP
ncbi:hypothetical protein TNCV_4156781 [Trichonephila clavipes]|nr:hypothetical protein TNCV_4156781 [Trichonephila clavipes]